MNFTDLIIIYLACGAPLGVYHFVQNRNRTDRGTLVFQSLLRFIFWIPFAVQLVAQRSWFTNLYNAGFVGTAQLDAKREIEFQNLRKSLEDAATDLNPRLSVFEFREAFDRYAGLTEELNHSVDDETDAEYEIFRISGHTNKSIGANCLRRRNRERISFHQMLARRDLAGLFYRSNDPEIAVLIAKLAAMLGDDELRLRFDPAAENRSQSPAEFDVSLTESELWRAEKQRTHQEQTI